jgi:hypothetical protein
VQRQLPEFSRSPALTLAHRPNSHRQIGHVAKWYPTNRFGGGGSGGGTSFVGSNRE